MVVSHYATFRASRPAEIAEVLTEHAEHKRRSDDAGLAPSPNKQSVVCPSALCDARLKSSRVRRPAAVVFASDLMMADDSTWPHLKAAVVITESSIYLFEGFSHHFGASWKYEGEDDDGTE